MAVTATAAGELAGGRQVVVPNGLDWFSLGWGAGARRATNLNPLPPAYGKPNCRANLLGREHDAAAGVAFPLLLAAFH